MTKLKMVTVICLVALVVPALAALQAQEMVEVEHRSAEVVRVVGRTVIIRTDTGEFKKYTSIPEDVTIYIDGKKVGIRDLREGMKLNAVRFENVPPPSTVTIEEVKMMEPASAAPAAPAAPAAKPMAPAPPAPAQLPKTGSHLPLSGQAGLALLLLGGGIAVLRRF